MKAYARCLETYIILQPTDYDGCCLSNYASVRTHALRFGKGITYRNVDGDLVINKVKPRFKSHVPLLMFSRALQFRDRFILNRVISGKKRSPPFTSQRLRGFPQTFTTQKDRSQTPGPDFVFVFPERITKPGEVTLECRG